MISQLFKTHIPKQLLISLLEDISIKTDKSYIVNNTAYKKGIYNQSICEFINNCRPYYFLSKRKYLDRKLTYKSFMTILRQICNYNNITYTSKIKYDKSVYDIEYTIFFSTEDVSHDMNKEKDEEKEEDETEEEEDKDKDDDVTNNIND
jgi:hypothetical protein